MAGNAKPDLDQNHQALPSVASLQYERKKSSNRPNHREGFLTLGDQAKEILHA